jgi:hypothetical protein
MGGEDLASCASEQVEGPSRTNFCPIFPVAAASQVVNSVESGRHRAPGGWIHRFRPARRGVD